MKKGIVVLLLASFFSLHAFAQTASVKALPSNKVYALSDLSNGTIIDSMVMGVKNYLILQNSPYSTIEWLINCTVIGPNNRDTLVVVPSVPSVQFFSMVFDNYANYFTTGFTSICPAFPPEITRDKASIIFGDSATLLMENVLQPGYVYWEQKPLNNNNVPFSGMGYIGNPITVRPAYSTVYKATYPYSDYCLTDVTDTLRVAIPKPSISASDSLVCPYDEVTYTTESGKFNYEWNVSGIAGVDYDIYTSSPGASNSIVIGWYRAGTYTVSVNYMPSLESGQKADTAASILTTVGSYPRSTLTQSPGSSYGNSICLNTPVTYKTESGQFEYSWYLQGTENVDYRILSGGVSSTDSTVTVKWLTYNSQKYINVSYQSYAGCYSNTAYVFTYLKAVPTVSVTPSAASILPGGSTTLTASGATTYVWSPSAGLSATSGSSVTAAPAYSTTYKVVGTTSECSDSANATVSVLPPPCTAGVDDQYEPNPNQRSATSLTLGAMIYANIKDSKDQDWYVFTTSGAGLYTVEFVPSGEVSVNPTLSTSNGTKLSAYSTTGKYIQTFNLTKKTVYYIKINDPKLRGTACYTLKIYAGAAARPAITAQTISPSLALMPNPAHDVVQIGNNGFSGRTWVQLTDAQGRLIRQAYFNAAGQPFALDLNGLGKGVYMISLADEYRHRSTKKLVIE